MMTSCRNQQRNRGTSLVEYGIIITLLSATVWGVFATWKVWGWGETYDYESQTGEARSQILEGLPTTPAVPPAPPEPAALVNNGGTFTVENATATTRISARYMGANAGLATVSSLWMRVRSMDGAITDQQLTANNTGAARTVVADMVLNDGDQVSFFERIKPKAWSSSYYNFQNSSGRLNDNGTTSGLNYQNDDYYDVYSSASSGPNNVTTVTNYAEGTAGNIFGTDEFHIGFEDLALDYAGCDRDYNDAELRVAIF